MEEDLVTLFLYIGFIIALDDWGNCRVFFLNKVVIIDLSLHRSNKIHAFANLVVDDQIFLQLKPFLPQNSQINLDPGGDNLWGKFSWHMTFNTILAQTMLADCIGQFPWKQRETSIPFPSNWYLLWKWECYFFTAEKIDSSSNI